MRTQNVVNMQPRKKKKTLLASVAEGQENALPRDARRALDMPYKQIATKMKNKIKAKQIVPGKGFISKGLLEKHAVTTQIKSAFANDQMDSNLSFSNRSLN